jgi:hypothetical protein
MSNQLITLGLVSIWGTSIVDDRRVESGMSPNQKYTDP